MTPKDDETRKRRQAALMLWRRRYAETVGFTVEEADGRFYLYRGGRLTFVAIGGFATAQLAWNEAYLLTLDQESDAADRIIAGAVEDRLTNG